MQAKDPYIVLGLKDDATQEQVENAYRTLRKKYEDLRFSEGEEGAQASRMIGELDRAYADCMEDLQRRVSVSESGSRLGAVEELIKQGKLDEAQAKLDTAESRDAEWHYVQAIIYFKRNWHVESKKQLEIALTLDPNNEKYKRSHAKLTAMLNNAGAQNAGTAEQNANPYGQQQQQRGGYARPQQTDAGADTVTTCCNTCSTLICCDCCCEMMGGDLIPCC